MPTRCSTKKSGARPGHVSMRKKYTLNGNTEVCSFQWKQSLNRSERGTGTEGYLLASKINWSCLADAEYLSATAQPTARKNKMLNGSLSPTATTGTTVPLCQTKRPLSRQEEQQELCTVALSFLPRFRAHSTERHVYSKSRRADRK